MLIGNMGCVRDLLEVVLTKHGNQLRSKGATLGTTILICWYEQRHTAIQDLIGSERDRGG